MKAPRKVIFLCLLLIIFIGKSRAQSPSVFVDRQGVMRWTDNKKEVQGFGVNYTVPFAHAYRSAGKLGIDPLRAIDQDVYHFARMGFDLYRVHIWDTEICDTLGNLLSNEHLDAFDYLIHKLNERNINYVLTPIAFWGGGWPEPDQETPGFSWKYGKDSCLTNPQAIKAQENYLAQFLNHTNPYTGLAYKEDPRVLAVEISNEPHHRGTPSEVKTFIQKMVKAVKSTGYKNPVFYNVSHSVHLAETYFDSGIDGGTFQWYPTGLGYKRELPFNVLPHIDSYLIPFDDVIKKHKGAKIVYEFDAADVAKSYPYPAMARSFRTAGIQLATHFSYDPMFMADVNSEYNTHHMNLAYTPHKAISLMICSEIFHQVPMYKDFGKHPQNTSFDNFTIKYEGDLAILNQANKFYYSTSTTISPIQADALEHIAGTGSSPVLSYDGAGAYFLDKLENGDWRLEVMPDPIITENAYGSNSLEKKIAKILWCERNMKIQLADLGKDFNLFPLNEGNSYQTEVEEGAFKIYPGVYILSKEDKLQWKPEDKLGNMKMGEFQAPANSLTEMHFSHKMPELGIIEEDLVFQVQFAAPEPGWEIAIKPTVGRSSFAFRLEEVKPFIYQVKLNRAFMRDAFMNYYFQVFKDDEIINFPLNNSQKIYPWEFNPKTHYTLKILKKDQPVILFDAVRDWSNISRSRWFPLQQLEHTAYPGEAEFQQPIDQLFTPDKENLNGPAIYEFSSKHYLNPIIGPIREYLSDKEAIVFKGRALVQDQEALQVALVMRNGAAFGATIQLTQEMGEHRILLSDLKPVQNTILPKPYPTFMPHYYTLDDETDFDISEVEALLFTTGTGSQKKAVEEKHGYAVVWVVLE